MTTRLATVGDAAAIAAVHVASWQQAYRGLLPQDFLDTLDPARRVARWRADITVQDPPYEATVVCTGAARVLGFVNVGPSRDDDAPARTGEIRSIYLLPEVWGSGHGRRLMTDAVRLLRDAGRTTGTLWVLDGNDRAIGFYEATGWTADGARKSAVVGGVPVTEVRYRIAL